MSACSVFRRQSGPAVVQPVPLPLTAVAAVGLWVTTADRHCTRRQVRPWP